MNNIISNQNNLKEDINTQNHLDQIESNDNNLISPLPERIPILYLWFGQNVPEDYLISLAKLKYPIIFLKNPPDDRKWKRQILDVQMSDYYRLKYLYDNGGIYSDFDNHINYQCLMDLLKPYRNKDKLVFMTDKDTNRKKKQQTTNNLIFAPFPKMPILKKMLDSINEQTGKIWNFAGLKFIGQFQEHLQVEMQQCVLHTGDWSWYKDSNRVLNLNTDGRGQFIYKTFQKADIMKRNQNLEIQVIIYRVGVLIIFIVGIFLILLKKFYKKNKKAENFIQISDQGVKIKSNEQQSFIKN